MNDVTVTDGLLDAALEIAERRANTLRYVKELILLGDDESALQLVKEFLGIEKTKPEVSK